MSQKTQKTKPFSVISNDEEVLVTGDYNEALGKVDLLMKEDVSQILLNNNKSQRTLKYSKGRYDKNYKVESIAYIHPVAPVETETDTSEQ